MNLRFALRMVRRELRASARRLGLHTLSIAVGVAALVAINSFRANLEESVHEQARTILGSDLELRSNRPFPDSVQAVLDSVKTAGVAVSYTTSFASMALVPRSGLTRLVQVRAIAGGFPYYGGVETRPAGLWQTFRAGANVLVDPAVLIELDARVGDTLRLGAASFVIAGEVTNYPGEVSLQSAIGPRVYLPLPLLDATNLIQRGSRAFYSADLEIPDVAVVNRFLDGHREMFRRHEVRDETVDETESDLTSAFDRLARFLGLVGLAALLLGGVGVASAVGVWVRSRLDTVAVLRCVGARQRTVFAIYLAQAIVLGLVGALVGVALGVAVQLGLPHVLGDFLPLDVRVRIHPPAILMGLGLGVLAAVAFALLPLLTIRGVPPLRALRRDADDGRPRWDRWRVGALAVLAAVALGVSLWQAPNAPIGFAFGAAIGVTTLALALTSGVLMFFTRRLFPHGAAYVVRQGIANLFRPRNQTLAVTLALGFGVFLIATLFVVQGTLLRQFRIDARPDRPNLVMFDIQSDQRRGVDTLLRERGLPVLQQTPIVPARIAAINGQTVEEILNGPDRRRYERWALRHVYRNTYRDTVVGSEEIVAGRWWRGGVAGAAEGAGVAGRQGGRAGGALPQISVEEEVAKDLNLALGDTVTWDVQGVKIATRVTSFRRVNWVRFEPNFFVVFQPGALETAPQMLVTMTRVEDPAQRAAFQRALVERFPNVAAVDLTLVQRTLDTVIGKVSLAIRFMALFSIASGILILIGALATSRLQRLREVVLLRTLGATARQVRAILFTEYAALGALGALTGIVLAGTAGWVSARFLFEVPFRLPVVPLAVFWVGGALLTTAVGALTGREIMRKSPLEVLRSISE